MKKILYVVGSAIVAALGVTTTAAVLTQVDTDTSTTEISYTMSPASSVPMQNSTVASAEGVARAYIKFPEQGFDILQRNPDATGNVVVKKDGEVIGEYPVQGQNVILRFDRFGQTFNNLLGVEFPEPLTAPGKYTVDFPGGVVSYDAFDAANISNANKPYTLTFTIADILYGVPSLAPGSEVSPVELATFKITYPEGTEITYVSGTPTLEHWDPTYCTNDGISSPRWVKQTDYNVSIDKNVIIFTAKTPETIIPNEVALNSQWDAVKVPAGMFTLKRGEETITTSEMVFERYGVRAFSPGSFVFTPAINSRNVDIKTLDEIKVKLPAGASWAVANPTTMTQITLFEGSTYNYNTAYNYGFKEVSADGTTVTFVAKAPYNSFSASCNRDIAISGSYSLRIPKNLFKSGDVMNSQMDFVAYDIKGVDYNSIYNSSPQNGSTVKTIGNLTLNLLHKAHVIANKANTPINVYYNNGQEPIASFEVGSTTTAAALSEGGSLNVAYPKIQLDGKDISDPGVYTYVIPAGVYADANGLLNPAVKIDVFVGGGTTACTFTPASGVYENGEFICNSKFDRLSELTLTFPEATKVELTSSYRNVLQNSKIGTITKVNIGKDAPAITTVTGAPSFSDAIVNGNSVTLRLSSPYAIATPTDRYFGVMIAQGLVLLTKEDGSMIPSSAVYAKYSPLPVAKGELLAGEAFQIVNAPLAAEELSTLFYHQSQTLYDQANSTARLLNPEGVVVATYKGEASVTGEDDDDPMVVGNIRLNNTYCIYRAADQVSALPAGNYTFVIPAGALLVSSPEFAESELRNTTDFEFPITIKSAMFELDPYISNYYPAQSDFTSKDWEAGMTQIVWRVASGLNFNSNAGNGLLYKNGVQIASFSLSDPETVDSQEGVMAFYFDESLVSGSGQYSILLPEGAFTKDGSDSAVFIKHYEFTADAPVVEVNPEYTFTPAEGLWTDGLNIITLALKDVEYLNYDSGRATLEGPNGLKRTKSYPSAGDIQIGSRDCNTLTWDFTNKNNPINWVSGEYTLTIPKGTLNVNDASYQDGEGNVGEIIGKWTLAINTGICIAGIEDADIYNVYTLGGTAVILNGTREALLKLDAGMYIINGKTVIIRK